MYEWALDARPKNDLSHLYDLNPSRFKDQVESMSIIMLSITLRVFYGIPVLVVLLVLGYQIGLKLSLK